MDPGGGAEAQDEEASQDHEEDEAQMEGDESVGESAVEHDPPLHARGLQCPAARSSTTPRSWAYTVSRE